MLSHLNTLIKTDSGIWIATPDKLEFEYSDGDTTEEMLRSILTKASDLTSFSLELEQQIYDWPSEYHLSPLRSNLLRYLDMSNCRTVLELGCGCGALTRYLGEQDLIVDAIEGSQRRAELARMRCRDLDNIEVASSNFFDLSLPTRYYDVVFFIGVMEYSGRFAPSNLSAEQAVSFMLHKAREALTPEGIIVIAIENRIGHKYLCGAGEDHYGIPFEGINNYPNYSGIKTWSQNEWEVLLQDADLRFQFHYPFPDYKLPAVVLNSNYLLRNAYAWTHLQGIPSTDYHAQMDLGDELTFWKNAHRNARLGAFSNSFLIIASKESNQFRKFAPYDFTHTSNLARNPLYRTQTHRLCEAKIVEKVSLYKQYEHRNAPLMQGNTPQPYYEGSPLSIVWIEELRKNTTVDKFGDLVAQYYTYLEKAISGKLDVGKFVDLLPRNIMVSSSSQWSYFDTEWSTTLPISVDFIFFRGVFYFIESATEIFAKMYTELPAYTLRNVLEFCFSRVGQQLEDSIPQFLEWEEKIQNCALVNRQGASTHDLLRLRAAALRHPVQLFWSANAEHFLAKNSLTTYISEGDYYQKVRFDIPHQATTPLMLRLDPSVHPGIFDIDQMTIYFVEPTKAICLQHFTSTDFDNSTSLRLNDIASEMLNQSRVLKSLTSDPYFVWNLPKLPRLTSSDYIRVEVVLKWISTGIQHDKNDTLEHLPTDNIESEKTLLEIIGYGLKSIRKAWLPKK
ncbi:MAG: hypothetical protein CL398_05925 [Acidiferrobacteraceae bacterium]|nr:hypothetical protein [Acidiferrobacteraceae bacterium]